MQRRSLCALLASPAAEAAHPAGAATQRGGNSGESPAPELKNPLSAIDFSPQLPGQAPHRDPKVGGTQIGAPLAYVAPLTRRIRTYGCVAGRDLAPTRAQARGLQVSTGAWLNTDTANKERQLANLIAIGNAGRADVVVTGNEVMFCNERSVSALADHVRRVQAAAPGLRVCCADVRSR